MIAIVDYGMGNLHSVSKALERLGYDYEVTDQADRMEAAKGVLLPGVGAFGDAMKELRRLRLDETLLRVAEEGKPLLGICLGMQLLFETSDEGGEHKGLSILPGHVRRFPRQIDTDSAGAYKVPHMGWNKLQSNLDHPLLQHIEDGGRYAYFVHSYYVADMADAHLLAYADYGVRVPAIVGKESTRSRVYGMQFHPEKSSRTGIRLLSNFVSQCEGVHVR
jgi:imidazole glycerol-phosphate synthase subunit HisH